jgi:hypothetical protein
LVHHTSKAQVALSLHAVVIVVQLHHTTNSKQLQHQPTSPCRTVCPLATRARLLLLLLLLQQVCKEVQDSHGKLLKDWVKGIQGECPCCGGVTRHRVCGFCLSPWGVCCLCLLLTSAA